MAQMQSGNKKQSKTYKYRKEKIKLPVVANFGWVMGPRYLVKCDSGYFCEGVFR